MSEKDTILHTSAPRTRESLAADLRALGLRAGMTVIMHSAMSKLGWVCGGPVAVIQALMDVLTPEGTLVMPTHSSENSNPEDWMNPAVPAAWIPTIKASMPAYDPLVTPTRAMGRIVETFRTWPGVIRSAHPNGSFAAWGRDKERIIEGHGLPFRFGEMSPLARLYEQESYVLLLGVGYDNCTSFHLAENRVAGWPLMSCQAAILQDGERVWATYQDIDMDSDRFPEIGVDFEKAVGERVQTGEVGSAVARLLTLREGVDFATRWLAGRKESGSL